MLNKTSSSTRTTIKGEEFVLLPEKVIYWPAKKCLLIADLHLGKASHFRANGIAVPPAAAEKNWQLLHQLFQQYLPEKVYFLGDLFHSTHNKEWEEFEGLIKGYDTICFELILGNHDILPPQHYTKLGFTVHEELIDPPFLFTHEPITYDSNYYNLAGHIHPGVKLKGKGKLSHRAACFYFGKNSGLLPAFGSFTGLATLNPKKEDLIFVIVNEQVISV